MDFDNFLNHIFNGDDKFVIKGEDHPKEIGTDYCHFMERKNGKINLRSYLIMKALLNKNQEKEIDEEIKLKFGFLFTGKKFFQDIIKIMENHPDFKYAKDCLICKINNDFKDKLETFKQMGNKEKENEIKQRMKEEISLVENFNINTPDRIFEVMINNFISIYCYDTSIRKDCLKLFKEYLPIYEKTFNESKVSKRIKELVKELNLSKTKQTMIEYILIFPYDNRLYHKLIGTNMKKLSNDFNDLRHIGILNDSGRLTSLSLEYFKSKNKKLSDLLFKNNEIKASKNTLDINDYPENMKKDIKYIIKLLKNHKDNKPMNILLYGIAGSGKSSLVNLLQKEISNKKFFDINIGIHIDSDMYCPKNAEISQGDAILTSIIENSSFYSHAKERMKLLNLCNKVSFKNKFVFVMDECDDVLNSSNGTSDNWLTGKKEINDLLQSLNVPVIWITNHKNKVDASTFRRFQYSIKFEQLSFKQRKKIWEKQIEINNAKNLCKNLDLDSLSYKYNITPGIINNVIEQLVALKPNKNEVKNICEDLLKSYCELTDIQESEELNKPENEKYDISGLNIESNFTLEQILQSLQKFSEKLINKENKNKNMNILLNGIPGTGKTEFAKYISRYLKMPLIYKNYGDLASCWVGETEHNIAKIFKEAEETNSILFLDEADSLFSTRENSHHSWEVTQVNEILTRMERFKGIFIASTNFINNLDKASLRRFAFKIKFKSLNNEGKIIFLKRFFNVESKNYDELNSLENVTPGDFKAIRDRLSYIDVVPDYNLIINELKDEIKYKQKNTRIGF